MQRPRHRVGLRKRLPHERERRRQADAVAQRDSLQVAERLAGTDVLQRPPVVARELAPDVVHEGRLVGRKRRQRQVEDQVRDVLGTVPGNSDQEQRQ
jgi:hypothetical protein